MNMTEKKITNEQAAKCLMELYDNLELEYNFNKAQILSLQGRISELSAAILQVNNENDLNYSVFSPREKIKDQLDDLYAGEIDNLKEEEKKLNLLILDQEEKLKKLSVVLEYVHNNGTGKKKGKGRLDEFAIKLLETQEIERKRIARDLHDSPVQNLTNLVHKSELCIKLVDIDTIRTKLELESLINIIHKTIDDMREIIYDLRPMSIDDLGLVVTVERYINKLMSENENINIKFNIKNEEIVLMPVVKITLFRIIQEACNNTLKHANASEISILIIYEKDQIILEIKDNGKGFDYGKIKKSENKNFGLSIMRERVYLLSGKMDINSEPDKGTEIYVTVPILGYMEDKDDSN